MEQIYFGRRIAALRKARGMTQEALAQRLGITNQAVSKWESDQCCPDIMQLPALADLFEISMDALFGRQGPALPESREQEPVTVIGELPWEDNDDLHAVCFIGHRLVRYQDIPSVGGKRERFSFSFSCLGFDKSGIRANEPVQLHFSGNVGNIYSDYAVYCTDSPIGGNVQAGDGVECTDVGGEVHAGDSVTCGSVRGNVFAGDSVSCAGNIGGNAQAGDDIRCEGMIGGNASVGGDLECGGDIGGRVQAGGDVECRGSIRGDLRADGNVSCTGDISGNVTTSGDVECHGSILSDLRADGDVNCAGDITGNVTASGDVDCTGSIGGNASSGGDIRCASIQGSASARGDINMG
ncbi:MAG: helix-turn-helix domain-containing protein [Faecousia sp.]